MEFEVLKEKLGLPLAVVLTYEQLLPEFFKGMAIYDWIQLYYTEKECAEKGIISKNGLGKMALEQILKKEASIGEMLDALRGAVPYNAITGLDEIDKIIYSRICEQAVTFDDWFKVYCRFKPKTEMNKTALGKIMELAVDFNQRLKVFGKFNKELIIGCRCCDCCSGRKYDPEFMKAAETFFRKTMEMAKTFDDFLALYKFGGLCEINKAFEQFILLRLTELAQTFEQNQKIYEVTRSKEFKWLAFQKLYDLAKSFDEWFFVRDEINKNGALADLIKINKIEKALIKAAELNSSFEQWKKVYPLCGSENLTKTAKENMAKLASSFEELLFLAHRDGGKEIIDKVFKLTETPDQLIELCNLAKDNVCQWDRVIKKAKEIEAGFDKWKECCVKCGREVAGNDFIWQNRNFMKVIWEMTFQSAGGFEDYFFVYNNAKSESYGEIASQCLRQISKVVVVS